MASAVDQQSGHDIFLQAIDILTLAVVLCSSSLSTHRLVLEGIQKVSSLKVSYRKARSRTDR